jgi:rRNA maturation endonuclease Nob1
MSQQKTKLVVDTNTFITTPMELANMASIDTMMTTPSVLAEIKDAETKNKVQTFFPTLVVTAPSTKGRNFVIEFVKHTGDFISLSQTDIDVIALAYDMIEAEGKRELLRSSPKHASIKLTEPKRRARRSTTIWDGARQAGPLTTRTAGSARATSTA